MNGENLEKKNQWDEKKNNIWWIELLNWLKIGQAEYQNLRISWNKIQSIASKKRKISNESEKKKNRDQLHRPHSLRVWLETNPEPIRVSYFHFQMQPISFAFIRKKTKISFHFFLMSRWNNYWILSFLELIHFSIVAIRCIFWIKIPSTQIRNETKSVFSVYLIWIPIQWNVRTSIQQVDWPRIIQMNHTHEKLMQNPRE